MPEDDKIYIEIGLNRGYRLPGNVGIKEMEKCVCQGLACSIGISNLLFTFEQITRPST